MRVSYTDTDDLVNRVADVLPGLGYGLGDIVMVRAANGWPRLPPGWRAPTWVRSIFR